MAKKTILLITTPAMGKSTEVKRLRRLGYSVMDFDIKGTKPFQMRDPEIATEVVQKANFEYLTTVGNYYDFIAIHANALNFEEILNGRQDPASVFFRMFDVVFLISHTCSHQAQLDRIARRDGTDSSFYKEAWDNYDSWVKHLEHEAELCMERAYKRNKDHPRIFWDLEGEGYVESVTKLLLTAEYDDNSHTIADVSRDYYMEIADKHWQLYFSSETREEQS